ncbi:MAG: alpha/beta hydrolase [Actinobacteria bacterium]|nr:alpha/beta hydrolase [Actinomycetota bacterium]
MRVTTDDGVDLEVLVAGDTASPALVLLHGFSGAKEDFTDHLDALATTHRVAVYDARGHGESGKPGDDAMYSLARMASDVFCVADALGITSMRLLGNSMGGMVAQHVVLARPERVEALVLQSTWPGPVPFDRAGAVKAAEIARSRGIEELHRVQAAADPLTTPAHALLLAERPGYAEFGDRKFLAQDPAMYAAVVLELFDQGDRSEALAAVRCPTLVIAGEQDDGALPGCRRLAEVISGARLEVVPDAGHSPQFENPDAWLDVLTAFLAGLPR